MWSYLKLSLNGFTWTTKASHLYDDPDISIRPAAASDLDAITKVGLAALPSDPAWPYRFPHAVEFAEDHAKYSRIRFSEYLDNMASGGMMIMLAEASSKEDDTCRIVIAISMWQMPGSHIKNLTASTSSLSPPSNHVERRDADPARMRGFRQTMRDAKERLFNQKYGQDQLSLLILATHPEYRKRGAGSRLIDWGLHTAKLNGLAVTLFASPMGRTLYEKKGFDKVDQVRIQIDNEKACLDLTAMVNDVNVPVKMEEL